MQTHPRWPAILVFVGVLGAGLLLFAATGQFGTARGDMPLESIERQILQSTDPKLWCLYGEKLSAAGQFASSAKAYERAVELAPNLTDARLNRGLALGRSGDARAFFDYINQLAIMYPKLAADLLQRSELAPLHADARWASTEAAVKAQAMD